MHQTGNHTMQIDSWLADRVAFLKTLKSRTEQQELLVLLVQKPERTPQDNKTLAVLVRAEKASVYAAKARQDAAIMIAAERKAAAEAERKAREREMYETVGLLGLAGLLDKQTGKPTICRGELLGGLLELVNVRSTDPRRADWKRAGDALLELSPGTSGASTAAMRP
jgi:hypothetical protein